MGHQNTGICQDPRIRDSEVESTGLRDRDRDYFYSIKKLISTIKKTFCGKFPFSMSP